MKNDLFLYKVSELGRWRCKSGAKKNMCDGQHICKFVLSKKKFKPSVSIDLRPFRVQKRDQVWCPKQIVI